MGLLRSCGAVGVVLFCCRLGGSGGGVQEGGSAGSAIVYRRFCGALVGGRVVIVALAKVLIWGKLLVCPNPKYPAFTPP